MTRSMRHIKGDDCWLPASCGLIQASPKSSQHDIDLIAPGGRSYATCAKKRQSALNRSRVRRSQAKTRCRSATTEEVAMWSHMVVQAMLAGRPTKAYYLLQSRVSTLTQNHDAGEEY